MPTTSSTASYGSSPTSSGRSCPTGCPRSPTSTSPPTTRPRSWAGGDYYDFFPLPDDRWGILIADVSGHGTPAAVMMAITHSIAHAYPGPPHPPHELLDHVNRQLAARYTADNGTFVTAFYAIFDPKSRDADLRQRRPQPAPPEALRRRLDRLARRRQRPAAGPLRRHSLRVRLDRPAPRRPDHLLHRRHHRGQRSRRPHVRLRPARQALENCPLSADGLIESVLDALDAFTAGRPADDDRTLMVAKVC